MTKNDKENQQIINYSGELLPLIQRCLKEDFWNHCNNFSNDIHNQQVILDWASLKSHENLKMLRKWIIIYFLIFTISIAFVAVNIIAIVLTLLNFLITFFNDGGSSLHFSSVCTLFIHLFVWNPKIKKKNDTGNFLNRNM